MTYQFNKRNNQVKEFDPLLNVTTTTYDKTGRQTAVTDAEGKVTKLEFDALGQMKKLVTQLGMW